MILLYANRHFKHNMNTSSKFKNPRELLQLIDAYFLYIKGEYKLKPAKDNAEMPTGKIWIREPEPPTFCNLALYLGFNSMEDFKSYEKRATYSKPLQYARLRIEAAYEQLLFEKPTGAIFALKSMGWTDKRETNSSVAETNKTLKVEITTSGPNPAGNEKEVAV